MVSSAMPSKRRKMQRDRYWQTISIVAIPSLPQTNLAERSSSPKKFGTDGANREQESIHAEANRQ